MVQRDQCCCSTYMVSSFIQLHIARIVLKLLLAHNALCRIKEFLCCCLLHITVCHMSLETTCFHIHHPFQLKTSVTCIGKSICEILSSLRKISAIKIGKSTSIQSCRHEL